MTSPINDAINNVHENLDEFKERHLKKLETVTTKVSEAEERLHKLELMLRRPVMAATTAAAAPDSTFEKFIRKGLDDYQTKALHSGVETGGFMIPHAAVELLCQRLALMSPLRALASVTTITSDALELLLDKQDPNVGWVSETDDRPETAAPELAKIRIPVHQIYAKPRVSQKLLDDSSIAIESWLAEKVADKMARVESFAFFHGDGAGKPRGMLTHDLTALGKPKWGHIEAINTGVDNIIAKPEILIDTYYSLKSDYLPRASWLMPRVVAAQIRKMKDEATGAYLWQQSLAENTPDTLLGHPVYLSDDLLHPEGKAPASILFGDFKAGYQIVDRAQVHVLRDPYSAKPYVEFYTTKRVGGDVVNFEALRLIKLCEA